MKILWVCNVMLPVIAASLKKTSGNREGWLDGLCSALMQREKENGIELHVAFPVAKELDGLRQRVKLGEGFLDAYGFYEDLEHPECYDSALESRLKKIVEEVSPQVIHCFGTEFPHALALARVCPDKDALLMGLQGICGVIAQNYMADLPINVQKGSTFRDLVKRDSLRQQQEKFVARGLHEKELLEQINCVTGRTDFDREYVQKVNKEVQYFPMNETLRSCFYTGEWTKEKARPHSIFVSQGDYPLKGLHYLLRAAADLKKTYPDLTISVAGNGLVHGHTVKDWLRRSGYGRYLKQMLSRYDLEKQVFFVGKLTGEEMKAQYLQCSVFVCCSSNENSPNSLGEAMLLGTPCVAADVGGIPSLFCGGKDGILYVGKSEKQNPKEALLEVAGNLKEAIEQMWEEPEKAEEYGKNARNHARLTHDPETNQNRLLEIYEEIIKNQGKDKRTNSL